MTANLPLNGIEIKNIIYCNIDNVKNVSIDINECVLAQDSNGNYGLYMYIGSNGFIKLEDKRLDVNYAINYLKLHLPSEVDEEKVMSYLLNLRKLNQNNVSEDIPELACDKLSDAGYDDVIIFDNFSYDSALIGVSDDNRAIYDYDLMVEWIIKTQGWTEEEAMEWIDYNTIGAHIENGPIIMYKI